VRPSTWSGPRPGTAASTVSNGAASAISRASLAASGMSMSGVESIQELAARAASLGLSGAEVPGLPRRRAKETVPPGLLPKLERAPLQRPFRSLVKKVEKTSVDDLLKSHARQIEKKIATQVRPLILPIALQSSPFFPPEDRVPVPSGHAVRDVTPSAGVHPPAPQCLAMSIDSRSRRFPAADSGGGAT
jgi:hypothetical protein